MTTQIEIRKYNQKNNAHSRENKKEEMKMLNLEKIYTVKGSATRALNKAVANGEYAASELEKIAVDGGFKIVLVQQENEPMEYTDEELEARWHELVCQILPNHEEGENNLFFDWFIFQEGTNLSEIYDWFDGEYNEGLEALTAKRSYYDIPQKVRLSESQKLALNALFEVKPLAGKAENERVGIWFPFSAIYDSNRPCNLPKRSMGGIMGGLINRGLINFVADGKEYIGKRAVAVCITDIGLDALLSCA